MIEDKKCEICMEQPAVVLCSECHKCYCEKCGNFMHNLQKFKGHKFEAIAEGIIVNATCPFHNDTPLKLFCVNEVKLCCAMCERKKLHKDHKLVEITEIQKDNEIFSTQKVRELFEASREQANELCGKIENVIEKIENEFIDVRERVEKTFEEEHKKLKEEEARVLNELEEEKNRSESSLTNYMDSLREGDNSEERLPIDGSLEREINPDEIIEGSMEKIESEARVKKEKAKESFEEIIEKLKKEEARVLNELEEEKDRSEGSLVNHLDILNKVLEHSIDLSKASASIKGKCSRLMELNIVGKMEKQRKELELLCEEKITTFTSYGTIKREISHV